jgi:hypothetical protein
VKTWWPRTQKRHVWPPSRSVDMRRSPYWMGWAGASSASISCARRDMAHSAMFATFHSQFFQLDTQRRLKFGPPSAVTTSSSSGTPGPTNKFTIKGQLICSFLECVRNQAHTEREREIKWLIRRRGAPAADVRVGVQGYHLASVFDFIGHWDIQRLNTTGSGTGGDPDSGHSSVATHSMCRV